MPTQPSPWWRPRRNLSQTTSSLLRSTSTRRSQYSPVWLLWVLGTLAGQMGSKATEPPPPPPRFTLVVLATFPRSGTTWTLNLLRAASEVASGTEDKPLLQAQPTVEGWPSAMPGPRPTQLVTQLLRLHRASLNEASDADLLNFFCSNNLTRPFEPHPEYNGGVKAAPNLLASTPDCVGVKDGTPETLTMDKLPPVVIKTHIPTIDHEGGSDFLALLREADLRIHTIRNPVDNILSRCLFPTPPRTCWPALIPWFLSLADHGNSRAFVERNGTKKAQWWPDLLAARRRNATTPHFDGYVREMAHMYHRHHTHWLTFVDKHGDQHPSLFVRYEALCSGLHEVFPSLLRQMGYSIDARRMRCAMSMFPCTAASNYPEHRAYFTKEQISHIMKISQSVTKTAGYHAKKDGTLKLARAPSALFIA